MPDPDRPRLNVTFYGYRGPTEGYLVRPPSGNGPGLVVIHDWWGLTEHVAGLVDRFAATGFVALAPDLYGGATARDVADRVQVALEGFGEPALHLGAGLAVWQVTPQVQQPVLNDRRRHRNLALELTPEGGDGRFERVQLRGSFGCVGHVYQRRRWEPSSGPRLAN